MTPDIDIAREFVKKMYHGDRWKRRVLKMSDSQILAIYLKQQVKIAEAEKKKRKSEPELF